MSFWELDGKLVVDDFGHPIDCEQCPCEGAMPCAGCTTPGKELIITFLQDMNVSGTCTPNCSAWINSWVLQRLTDAQANDYNQYLISIGAEAFFPPGFFWPYVLPSTNNPTWSPYPSPPPCMYGIRGDLPCGAFMMYAWFLTSGSSGTIDLEGEIWFGFDTRVGFSMNATLNTASSDCIKNYTKSTMNASTATWTMHVDYVGTYPGPCDFTGGVPQIDAVDWELVA
jgi:hypothetical protein